ncbi:hypothetical protein SCOCK_1260003 [Actinacidiphila cocklensis]|uniref:Uncharacterized protein n=1 Tax=Actinacidiphila cocklensis TaxID=887465 RepID=A0A9W4DQD7_9ACTN|nr:hypothetical protein SCOCK_1260003 [Actinacidiphila cocklensis]
MVLPIKRKHFSTIFHCNDKVSFNHVVI